LRPWCDQYVAYPFHFKVTQTLRWLYCFSNYQRWRPHVRDFDSDPIHGREAGDSDLFRHWLRMPCYDFTQLDINTVTIEVLHNTIGFCGIALIIAAYLMLQLGKLQSNQLSYSVLNLVGAAAVIVSLCFEMNLPSLTIEVFWCLISLIGIFRYYQVSRNVSTHIDETQR
ncbi:MAG: hypothetical protein AAGA30_09705, partial [Planctomycetota bacterium]